MDLLERIRQAGAQSPIQEQRGMETQAAQQLARATTGKQVTGGATPRIQNQAEQAGMQMEDAQRAQLQFQAGAQARDLEREGQEQQEQFETEQEKLQLQKIGTQQKYQQELGQVLDQWQQEKQVGQFRRQQARTEHAGFLMRLSSEKYENRLQIEGARARLNQEMAFREEMQRTIFRDEIDLLEDDLDFRALLNADERQFKEFLAQMDLDYSIKIAEQKRIVQNIQAKGQATDALMKAGGDVYDKYESGEFDTKFQESNLDREIAGERQLSYPAYQRKLEQEKNK